MRLHETGRRFFGGRLSPRFHVVPQQTILPGLVPSQAPHQLKVLLARTKCVHFVISRKSSISEVDCTSVPPGQDGKSSVRIQSRSSPKKKNFAAGRSARIASMQAR